MIVIVDYKMGNVGSILNMLRRIGAQAVVSADAACLAVADKLILPGVGAFDQGMQHLREMGLVDLLNHRVLDDAVPVLGICLGMQLLSRRSEEGRLPGLGWIPADTVRFRCGLEHSDLKIPHMGWNTVTPAHTRSLFQFLEDRPRFYFVHSYHLNCDDQSHVLGRTHHGIDFASSVQRGSVFGTQFHPEKSHRYGLQLLRNFVELR